MEPSKVFVFILSGRSGSGKTTVVNEVTHLLTTPFHDVPYIHIDGDNLDFIHPKESPESEPDITLMNLKSLFRNYYNHRRPSCGLVLISGSGMVFRRRDINQVIRDVCNEATISEASPPEVLTHAIILCADDETVKARLERREIGTDLQRHLESSHNIACRLYHEIWLSEDNVRHYSNVVQTNGRSVSEVAGDVIRCINRVLERETKVTLSLASYRD